VTHADGTLVSAESPALPGETVVIYAWGLGITTPAVQSGETSPVPAPVVKDIDDRFYVRFDFSPDAAPSAFREADAPIVEPCLTPGQIGLYQLNVQLPAVFPMCQLACGKPQSNLTIDISGSWSTDGAAICVKASQ
jgi:hypothetical protein